MNPIKLTFAFACALLLGVAQAQNTLDLSTIDTSEQTSGSALVVNGESLSGVTYSSSGTLTFTEAYTLSGSSSLGLVAGGDVTLTLAGVTISTPAGLSPLSTGDKNLTVVLADGSTNTLTPQTPASSIAAGVEVGNGTLTIEGNSGTLTVTGGAYSAAIGTYGTESSTTDAATGSIVIAGGVITATGGGRAAAIGGPQYRSFTGTISITGGDVTAQGGSGGAGIGMGYYQASAVSSISISGGTVHATGGTGGAGIGAAYASAAVGSITISNGAEVTATGGSSAAGIGGGYGSSSCDVTISGSTTSVVAYAGSNAAYAIGYGVARSGETLSAGSLTVNDGASVNTNGGSTPDGTALGALVINLASPVADPTNGITFSGTTEDLIITADTTKTLILQGQEGSRTITLVLPDGAKLSCPTGTTYVASLSAIRCLGSMTIEGDNSLTVDSLVLGYDSETGLGSDDATLTLSSTSTDMNMSFVVKTSCTGKVLCDGYVAVTLPASSNLGSYTPLASVTTNDGTFPYTYADSVDFSTLTRNATLPSGWTLDSSSTSCITLTAPSGVTLTQSGSSAVENLSLQLSGDATLSGVNLSVPAAFPAIALPENTTASLTLSGSNTLSASTSPAIEVPSSANLTLVGSGSLSASATTAAAIGCAGYDTSVNAGTITIALEGGSLSASATYGAGIGGGARVGVSSVTISSGTVQAVSTYGAGIGSGYNVTSSATTPSIAISGGSVTATSASGDPIGSNSSTNKAVLRVSNLGTTEVEAKTYATIPVISSNGTSLVNLSDATGLTILEVIDETSTAIIAETQATESCNLVTARQTTTGISTSESGTPLLTLADCLSLLNAGGTYILATTDGTSVARLDGDASTLTILDGTLSIDGNVTVQTNTGKSTPDTLTNPEAICALLEAALTLTNDSGTLSLSYAYNFGFQELKMNTSRNDDDSLSFAILTVGLTEGTADSQSGRTVTLSDATLAIYSGDTLIQSLDSPTFENGVCDMTPTSPLSADVVSLPLVVKLLPLTSE